MKKRCLLTLLLIFALMLVGPNVSFAKLAASQTGFPNAKLLVSADSVQDSIGKKNFVIIDARTAGYDASHIPGAINIKFGDYFTPGTGLLPIADLNSKLSAAGLKRSMTVVIYDNTSASFGAAGRIFWMLEYLGCNDVHILDGGWDKWSADVRPTETGINTLSAGKFKATVKTSRKATKERIKKMLGTKNFAIIDSRTDEEYNGWQLYGEARGGHISGAVQIPYAWFFNLDKTVLKYSDLKTMFESRGITRKKEVTAYCTVGIRSGFVYFLYRLMGYSKASNYDASIVEWAADSSLSMEKLPNYEKLVHPQWLKDLMDGKNVPNPPAGRYVVVATKHRDSGYIDKYIPGSILINKYDIEWYPTTVEYGAGRLWPDNTLKQLFENCGIDKDTTVIVYHEVPGGSPIFATRVVWALMYAGVKDVRLLNGGIDTWIASGFETTDNPAEKVPVDSFGTAPGEFPLHNEYYATTEYIEEIVAGQHQNALLADIRSWTEYIGGPNEYLSIGIPLTAVGRIPDAKWGHWGPSALVGGDFWDSADKTFRSYPEIATFWAEWGITADKTVSFYCGTGYRSAMAFFFAYLMGWPNISNYDGGFFEWAQTHPNASQHQIETGMP